MSSLIRLISPLIKNALNAQTHPESDENSSDDENHQTVNTEIQNDSDNSDECSVDNFQPERNVVKPLEKPLEKNLEKNLAKDVVKPLEKFEERECPGCYHCNWTNQNPEGYGCKRQYFGDN